MQRARESLPGHTHCLANTNGQPPTIQTSNTVQTEQGVVRDIDVYTYTHMHAITVNEREQGQADGKEKRKGEVVKLYYNLKNKR